MTGHWDSNPDPRADLALKSLIRRLLYQLSYTPLKLVAVEGIEPTSLDYQSSALAVELHREVVDPTGLKPAPHGLKGRRSVTRAPGQQDGCGGRIRTFDSRINNPVPYQLGYATRELAAATRVELAHPRLQDECSVIQLSYAAILVDWEGFKPSQEVCRTSMLSVTSPARTFWWLWVELNHQPRAYETLALIPLELHSR